MVEAAESDRKQSVEGSHVSTCTLKIPFTGGDSANKGPSKRIPIVSDPASTLFQYPLLVDFPPKKGLNKHIPIVSDPIGTLFRYPLLVDFPPIKGIREGCTAVF